MTTGQNIHRYVVRNYCRKECNSVADQDGGHFERNVGGPWMLAADVLPVLEELRRALTASGEALREYGHHKNSCRFVSNVPNPGIRPGSCTCGLEVAMRRANG